MSGESNSNNSYQTNTSSTDDENEEVERDNTHENDDEMTAVTPAIIGVPDGGQNQPTTSRSGRTVGQNTEITDDTYIREIDMTTEQKKRKLEQIYATKKKDAYLEEDEFEIQKVRKQVRENIFPKVKFCKGEGNTQKIIQSNNKRNGRKFKKMDELGKSHENADLTCKTGFEYKLLDLCGMEEGKKSLTQRANWWKLYAYYVKTEIRQQRGNIQYMIRKTLTEGKN